MPPTLRAPAQPWRVAVVIDVPAAVKSGRDTPRVLLRPAPLQAVGAEEGHAVRLAAPRDDHEEVAAATRRHVAVEPAFACRQDAARGVHHLDAESNVGDAVAAIVVQPAADRGAAPRDLIEIGIRTEVD